MNEDPKWVKLLLSISNGFWWFPVLFIGTFIMLCCWGYLVMSAFGRDVTIGELLGNFYGMVGLVVTIVIVSCPFVFMILDSKAMDIHRKNVRVTELNDAFNEEMGETP